MFVFQVMPGNCWLTGLVTASGARCPLPAVVCFDRADTETVLSEGGEKYPVYYYLDMAMR